LHEAEKALPHHLRDQTHPAGASPGCGPEPLHEKVPSLAVGEGAPGFPFLEERGLDPIRVVDCLQGRLSAHAEGAEVYRMKRVPLHLDDPVLADLREDAAPGRALPAGGGVPGRLADHHVFGRVDQGVKKLGRLGGAAGGK
jgi:hypothetical protein